VLSNKCNNVYINGRLFKAPTGHGMILGAIADDVTGATDLASLINRAGRAVLLSFGVPRKPLPPADALIIATKSRMAPVEQAKATALEAVRYLVQAGAAQVFFKYCSTFDSTERGNIGPVTEQLMAELGVNVTLACPSYPAYARTVYQGHLFVGTQLLAESSMRHHPLTPMTDSNLVRFLGKQCQSQVGLVPLQAVEEGAHAVQALVEARKEQRERILIADAVLDRHIATLAEAAARMRLITGGAALGGALAARQPSRLAGGKMTVPPRRGPTALLSGSCSAATLAQVENAIEIVPSRRLDPIRLIGDCAAEIAAVLDWAQDKARRGDFLVYSTADSERVRDVQAQLGADKAGALVEDAFGEIAAGLAKTGLRRFVIAGGETSGAVIRALDIRTLSFGDELDLGVPWTYSIDPDGYTFALKSGNFGRPDFFRRAIA
jgi:3-dehydrotetronate 4-kinase